ncbi:MAG: hypothetical protein J6L61_03580 [Ruminiclostridium sp.]|nr:hypothetical protein [Ruminiclostridium sp.]
MRTTENGTITNVGIDKKALQEFLRSVQPPVLTPENLSEWLDKHEISIGYDEIGKNLVVGGLWNENPEQLEANLPALVFSKIQTEFQRCTIQTVQAYISIVASRNVRNPAKSLVEPVEWDGVSRLPEIFAILGISGDELSKTLVKKWLIQCISLLYNSVGSPFGADGVFVLVGRQGIGKTRFFRRLAVESNLFGEGKCLNFSDKDTLVHATGYWLTELGEIESTTKGDREKLKAFITSTVDEYRRPYARGSTKALRRTSFCGSANTADFLTDQTGNRRFWTVQVEKIDLDRLDKLNVLQLWAEIKTLSDADRQAFRLTPEEREALANRNSNHTQFLPAEAECADLLADVSCSAYRVERVLQSVSDFKERNSVLKNYSVRTIGLALDKLGVKADVRKVNGKTMRARLLPRRIYNNGVF